MSKQLEKIKKLCVGNLSFLAATVFEILQFKDKRFPLAVLPHLKTNFQKVGYLPDSKIVLMTALILE